MSGAHLVVARQTPVTRQELHPNPKPHPKPKPKPEPKPKPKPKPNTLTLTLSRQELLQKFVRSDPRQQVRRAMLSSMLLLGHAPEDLFRYVSKYVAVAH